MLTLTETQLKNLEALLDELPLKYARPILQLINSFVKENLAPKTEQPEVEAETPAFEEAAN